MRRFLPVLAVTLLLSSAAFAKSGPNVAGLTSGMTIDAVAAKLGPDYHKATTSLIQKGEVDNFTSGVEGFNVLALGGKVVYVEHQQAFPAAALVSADELAKALASKYGTPTIKNDDDQSETWIIIDDKIVTPAALTDAQRACVGYETQGPFFSNSDKANFAFAFPRVPVQPQLAQCGTVIMAKPSLLNENPGLLSHLTVTMFDVKAAQSWYDQAMVEYKKVLDDAVDAARKNKPNL